MHIGYVLRTRMNADQLLPHVKRSFRRKAAMFHDFPDGGKRDTCELIEAFPAAAADWLAGFLAGYNGQRVRRRYFGLEAKSRRTSFSLSLLVIIDNISGIVPRPIYPPFQVADRFLKTDTLCAKKFSSKSIIQESCGGLLSQSPRPPVSAGPGWETKSGSSFKWFVSTSVALLTSRKFSRKHCASNRDVSMAMEPSD